VSTAALKSGSSSDDSRYAALQARIADLTSRRDALAEEIKGMLDAAAFGSSPVNERRARQLSGEAQSLLEQAHAAARGL
jgi:hypothetical protein